MFTDLRFQIADSASNLLKYRTLECHILDNIHISAHFLLFSFITDEASAGTREETLWILAKEKDACSTYFLLPICLYNEIIILSQILHARLPIADDTNIIIDKSHVNIIDGSTINILVFVISFALIIEELHAFVKVEFLALVANTHETFVRLICMKLSACRNVHQKNAILLATIIRTRQILAPNFYRRIAEIKRDAKQLIEPFLVSINPFYSASLVRNANGKHTTIGISHSHNGYC